MSEPTIPSGSPMQPLPNPGRNGCLQVLAVLVGIVMLLPGLCAIIIAGLDPHELMVDSAMLGAVFGALLVGAGGVALIWWAVKRPSPPR